MMGEAEPWLRERRWREGRVVAGKGGEAAGAWVFALLFAGASVAMGWAVWRKPALRHDFPAVLAVLFPIVAVVLLGLAVRKTVQWRKFGKSVLELATFPGVIGGQLVGIVYTQVKLQASEGFDVALSCVERVTTGHGKDRHSHDVVIWQEEQHLVRGAMNEDMTRSAIPVGFRIPRECKPSFRAAGYDDIHWKLRVRAKVPGVDYEATFGVPVYVTAESNLGRGSEIDPVAPYRAAEVRRTEVRGKGLAFWKDAVGSVHLRYGAGRNLGATGVWCLVAMLMVGVTCFLWRQPWNGVFGQFVMETLVGGFGLASLGLMMVCFVLLFQQMEVVADEREVVVTTRYLGMRFVRRVAAEEVQDVRMKVSQTSGEKMWYAVELVVPWRKADGSVSEKEVCVGSGLEKRDAEWVVERVMGAVGGTKVKG